MSSLITAVLTAVFASWLIVRLSRHREMTPGRMVEDMYAKNRDELRGPGKGADNLPISSYTLGMPVAGLPGLEESEEAPSGRTSADEVIYKAPPVDFLNRPWNMRIGVSGGIIRRLNPWVVLTDRHEAREAASEALVYCLDKLGRPTEQKNGFFVWETLYECVTLQIGAGPEGFSVSFIVTSKTVAAPHRP